jgi:hypothetical protein
MRMLVSLVIVMLAASGCGLRGATLEQRAIDYYNHMAGHSPAKAHSSFLTPAYRDELKQAGTLAEYDDFLRSKAEPSGRYPKASVDDIAIAEQDKFAITVANPELGPLFGDQKPVRWVKVGRNWYVYIGADTEIGFYGVFPTTLVPPEFADAAEAAAENISDDAEGEPLETDDQPGAG